MVDICEPGKVSDYLLVESRDHGEPLTNLKLQKLLYYAQAWFLALYGEPLFQEEFRAWVHGPVLPSQYQRFKHYQWRPILDEVARPDDIDPRVVDHLDEVLAVFGTEPATALEVMTHQELPWLEARGGTPSDEPSTAIIKKQTMREFYQSI
tara:strand:+ start:515 stop:967 length:453 start_codon:yes stop_codon:yes gene_type:complete